MSKNVYSRRAAAALIVSNDAMIAALVGAAIELGGFRAEFARDDEDVVGALTRTKATHLLLDCEGAAARNDTILGRALMTGARLFVFGSTRRLEDRRHRTSYPVTFIALPDDITRMRQLLTRRPSPTPEHSPSS